MSFADNIDRGNIDAAWYCFIAGLPYVFSNVSVPPKWETTPGHISIGGRSYTWCSTLQPDYSWGSVSVKARPWDGVGVANSMQLRFQLAGTQRDQSNDVMMQLFASSIYRGGVGVLTADLSASGVTMYLDDTSWANALGGYVYAGNETAYYSGKTATSLTGLVRGVYGSSAKYLPGPQSSTVESGSGPYIADHPISMIGRRVSVWMSTGEHIDGEFVPFGAAIQSAEDREIDAGKIVRFDPTDDGLFMVLDVQDLRSEIAGDILTRQPKAMAGHGKGIQIDGYSNRFSFLATYADGTTDSFQDVVLADNAATPLPDGVYTWQQIIDAVRASSTGANGNVTPYFYDGGDGKQYCQLMFQTDYVAALASISIIVDGDACLWRELGFETTQTLSEPGYVGSSYVYEFQADRGMPAFRYPTGDIKRRVYIERKTGPNFNDAVGFTDNDAVAIDSVARISDSEVVTFDDLVTESVQGVVLQYLNVTGRNTYGSSPTEEIYVELDSYGQEDAEVVQGVGFTNTSWQRTLLYLMHSGSGEGTNGSYDKGWRGLGLYLPESIVLQSSFEDTRVEDTRDNWAFFDPTDLRSEFIESELRFSQSVIVPDNTTGANKLTLYRFELPVDTDITAATVLDHSCIDSLKGITIKSGVDLVRNSIRSVNAGYNNATGKARRNITWVDGQSAATWGKTDPIEVDLRGFSSEAVARESNDVFALNAMANFARPMNPLRIPITKASKIWTLAINGEVALTHVALLNSYSVGRGVTSVLGRIIGKSSEYRQVGSGVLRGWLDVLVYGLSGDRFALLAPTVYGSSVSGSDIICNDNYHSKTGEAKDITWFEPGYVVRIYRPGDESSAVIRVIDSITIAGADASYITTTVAPSIVGPVEVEFAGYDNASIAEQQKLYAYMSDNDRKLDKASGSDRAITYA